MSFPWAGALGQPTPGPEVEDRATELVAELSAFLAEIPKFRLEVEESHDIYDEGQLLQLTNTRTLQIRRPNRARGRAWGDRVSRSFWYDGRNFTSAG